jgi:hypothetical protein
MEKGKMEKKIHLVFSHPLKTHPTPTKTTHFSNHPNQQNCLVPKNIHDSKTLNVAISHANSNRNKPIKQAHFLKFQAQVAIKTLISSPTCPLSRFLESLKSDLRCKRAITPK